MGILKYIFSVHCPCGRIVDLGDSASVEICLDPIRSISERANECHARHVAAHALPMVMKEHGDSLTD